jgi:queuine/archaeosine tRNA-ribosyltransferase
MARRLAPLLTGTSAGSLGPDDLREIGVSVVAIDILELQVNLGLEAVRSAGGLGRFTGWEGPILAVVRYSDEAASTEGWRGRGLPQALKAEGDRLRLRSPVDGSIQLVSPSDLTKEAVSLGAEAPPAGGLAGAEAWTDDAGPPPPGPTVITALAQDEAAAGKFWDGSGWAGVLDGAARWPACDCRACVIAGADYIAHMWRVREITAEHLLTWHNMHQLRLLVEEAS